MRACIQRVSRAVVRVGDETVGQIGCGVVVLLGVAAEDKSIDVQYLADRICGLRIFDDEQGKMNRSLTDVSGSMLVVSQFTLLADCRHGRRPSFAQAAPPATAKALYDEFVSSLIGRGIKVQTGHFRAAMQVELVNEGPVTLLVDSRKQF